MGLGGAFKAGRAGWFLGWLDFISLTGGVHGRGISSLGIGVLRVGSAGLGHWVTGFIKGFIVFIYPLLYVLLSSPRIYRLERGGAVGGL
jgi:hypothetical protein